MILLLIAGGVLVFLVGTEIGFRSGINYSNMNEIERFEKLIDRMAEIDPDAIEIMNQAAQELIREEAQVKDLEKLARIK